MASYTTNYNLKKPADSDSYDIADANGNMDIIDGALNTLNSKVTIQTLSTNGTTDADGFINTGLASSKVVLCAYATTEPYRIITFVKNSTWYLMVTKGTSSISALGNYSIGYEVKYYN